MADQPTKLARLPQEDFNNIENAVMETERGRWFLKEYAARNRHAETDKLLEAISRIESAMNDKTAELKSEPTAESISAAGEKIKFDLLDMMTAIANTKREIAAIGSEDENNSHINSATLELDAIVEATETATSQILETAESIQEQAWTLREEGLGDEHCDKLDSLSTDIYMACSFQDITGQRIQKVVQVLRYLENRLESMASIWDNESVSTPETEESICFKSEIESRPDAHLLNGPQNEGQAIEQDDVDLMFVDTEDLQAAEEMESMLEGMEQEDEEDSTPAASEICETTSEEELEEEAQSAPEDEVLIIKEDEPSEDLAADQSAEENTASAEAEQQAEAQAGECDLSLSDKDQEALFSTHEA